MKNIRIIFIILTSLFSIQILSATIIHIPNDFPQIQQGINVSSDGDTILVQPGTYNENINYNGHNIVLGSLFLTTADSIYISNTIIDGSMNGSVITFFNGEDTTAVLIGFTIRNGLADYIWSHHFGGGIFCAFANPTLKNLIITNNFAQPDGAGGGISLGGANPIITDVIIQQNFSSGVSGGLHIASNSNPILTNVIIKDNTANWGAGIYCYDNSNAILNNVVIFNNTALYEGGGILNDNCNLNITNSTITMNDAPLGAGIFCSGNSNLNILNSILWNNQSQGMSISGGTLVIINYSDIQGGGGGIGGNINEDPLFVDPLNYNFHLTEDSPCIDAGDPNYPLDPDGTITDMGAYYFHQLNEIDDNEIPTSEYELTNYPNPFNPSTTISFSLNNGNMGNAELIIYNLKGQKIKTFPVIMSGVGRQSSITWNGTDELGKPVTSGIYLYKLKTGDETYTKKMLLLK